MAVKLTPTDFPLLLSWLDQYVPQSFKVRGELKSHLRGDNPEPLAFFVDRWPDPQAVVRGDVGGGQEGSQTSIASVFGVNETALSTLLKDPSAVQWTGCNLLILVPNNLLSSVKAAAEEMEKSYTLHPVTLMKVTPQDLKPSLLPAGMKFQPVTDTEAGIMHSLRDAGIFISKTSIQRLAQRLPAVFLVTAEGHHVGHMLTYSCRTLGMLFVHPEFRRQGYAKVIETELARRHFDRGEDNVYVVVDDDNVPSINLHEALGFRAEGRFTWLVCSENSS